MDWRVAYSQDRLAVALFVSRQLHCLADLLHRHRMGELPGDIRLVISNHEDAAPLAAFYGIPFVHVPVSPQTREAAEERQLRLLEEHSIDLVVLARYMQVLSPAFVARYPARIINVHHSFLPAFRGARPYHAAFERGVKLIGATAHYVTEILDDGPIIEQEVVRVSHRDQLEDLIEKGRDAERLALARAVRWHLEHRILLHGAQDRGLHLRRRRNDPRHRHRPGGSGADPRSGGEVWPQASLERVFTPAEIAYVERRRTATSAMQPVSPPRRRR